MAKIVWLNQFRMKQDEKDTEKDVMSGGAETTIDLLIKKGKALGHDIKIMTPYSIDLEEIRKSDLVIFSNIIIGMKVTQFKMIEIDWIVEHKPFIKLEHDAVFCLYRNCQCDDSCPITTCKPFWWRKMFSKAKFVVFLSPLQLEVHRKFFWNELTEDKVACIPPCIKKSVMVPSESARQKGTYCVVGAIYAGKGIEDILDQYKALGKNLRFIGTISDPKFAGKIAQAGHTLVPSVPYNQMPIILQKYEYMIISRRIKKVDQFDRYILDEKENQLYTYMKEGFSRIIMEAYNCGVKVLVDKDSKKVIGRYSYNLDDEEMSNMCDKADQTFFDVLKNKGVVK